jgi:hypothetical protein
MWKFESAPQLPEVHFPKNYVIVFDSVLFS